MTDKIKHRANALLTEFGKITLNLAIQAVLRYTIESYTDEMLALVVICNVTLATVHHFEYKNPKLYGILYNGILGLLSPMFIIASPQWVVLVILFHFINQHLATTNSYGHSDRLSFIITSTTGWITCYLYFLFGEQGSFHKAIEIQYLFGDHYHFLQLFLGFICSDFIFLSVKSAKTKEIHHYLSKLQETNSKLEKANQDLKQAIIEKDSLLLRFSHEIRNPLNSLLGNIDLAYEATHDSSIREMLRDAKVSSEVLLQLISNVLDSAKLETRGLDINKKNHDFRRLMEKAWIVCSHIIKAKGLFGSVSVNTYMPTLVEFDSQRLMQILTNLVTNAVKFTDYGHVQIYTDFEVAPEIIEDLLKPRHFETHGEQMNALKTSDDPALYEDYDEVPKNCYESLTTKVIKKDPLKFQNKNEETNADSFSMFRRSYFADSNPLNKVETDGYLRFELVDSGCGMTKESVRNLFKKYGRVGADSNKRQIGLGIGLWITKQLVEAMGGRFEIYSIPNGGTCCVFVLQSRSAIKSIEPLPQSGSTNVKVEYTPTTKLQSKKQDDMEVIFQNLKVLVVEDEAYNREVSLRFLKKLGVKIIHFACNGAEGVSEYKSHPEGYFQVILMDVDMPVMNGKEATARIREFERQKNWSENAKIIILTAYADRKSQQELLDTNGSYRANSFISKPGSYEELKSTILQLQTKKVI